MHTFANLNAERRRPQIQIHSAKLKNSNLILTFKIQIPSATLTNTRATLTNSNLQYTAQKFKYQAQRSQLQGAAPNTLMQGSARLNALVSDHTTKAPK